MQLQLKMGTISSVLVIALCCLLSTTSALHCYECVLCGDEGKPISTNCSDGFKCGKLTMSYPKTDTTMVFKRCMRDTVNCDSYKNSLGATMMQHAFTEGLTAHDVGAMKLTCDYCSTDHCNGASYSVGAPLVMAVSLAAVFAAVRPTLDYY